MIYLDNAATTYKKPKSVYKKAIKFYKKYNANAGRGQHFLSKKAGEMVQQTEQELLEFLECDYKSKVIFTPSATIAINMVLQGLDYSKIKNVYITPFEHNAVLRVLYHLQKSQQFEIVELAVDKKSCEYNLHKITKQFEEKKPDLLIMSQVSNVLGIVAPVKELCKLSKTYNAINIIDMAQSAGLINQKLKEIAFDFAIFAGHKTLYAFQGVAGIIHKDNIKLNPIIFGGTGINSKDKEMPSNVLPGTANLLSIASLYYSLQYLKRIGKDKIEDMERAKTRKLLTTLESFEDINIVGKTNSNISVVSCTLKNYSVDDMAAMLNNYKICTRAGLHCSPLAHKFVGTEKGGTLRFSVSLFTSNKELKKLKRVLYKIL